jgi:hypothetical protein
MNKIVDKRGRELNAGDYVLIATSCTGTGHMRVAKIKEISHKDYDDENYFLKLRTICGSHYSNIVTKGWTDIQLDSTRWDRKTRQYKPIEGDIVVSRVVKIDDPTQFLSDNEIEGAKKIGLL